MKKLITAVICLVALNSIAQNEVEFAEGRPSYKLAAPQGWSVERTALTAKVSASGVEDLRLAPGFNDSKSYEYWSYTSLWSVESTFKTDAESIKNALTTYYANQLIKNIKRNKIPAQKIQQVKTWILELERENNDSKTFYGAISMLDYKKQQPISLNYVAHVRSNSAQNRTYVFYEFSPKPITDTIWRSLDQFWLEFDFVSSRPYSSN